MEKTKVTGEQIAFALRQVKQKQELKRYIERLASQKLRSTIVKRKGKDGLRIIKKFTDVYCEEGLNLRSKRPKRNVSAVHRMNRSELYSIDQSWSMDFVADKLFNRRRICALTVVDNFSRGCLRRWITSSKSNML